MNLNDLEVIPAQKRSFSKRQSDINATVVTLYVSVDGVEDNNTFILESTVGDSTSPGMYTEQNRITYLWNPKVSIHCIKYEKWKYDIVPSYNVLA